MNDIMAIGIAGGTGSGKTTITRLLSERFGKDVSVIYYDNYYKAHDDLTYDERAKINYETDSSDRARIYADAFDTELFLEDVAKLKRGEDVLCPVYDYTVHNRSNQTLLIKSAPVILLEGILLLSDERIRDLLDIKIFVDTDADVRILRRIMRDVKERKRSLESVVEQYLTTVKPMHEMYVEPSKRYANIIIPEGGHNMVAVNMLMERINAHINA